MKNRLTVGPSEIFLYRATGSLDSCPAQLYADDKVDLCVGPFILTLTPEAAHELAAHLAAAARKIAAQGGAQ